MKRSIIVLLFTFFIKFNFGQAHSIAGAWYWSDSTKQTSMFFKQDGSLSMHSGPKAGAILQKNLRTGTYILSNNSLIIKWKDNATENDKIKFLNNNSFQITLLDKANKKQRLEHVFSRVIDEEVIEVKP